MLSTVHVSAAVFSDLNLFSHHPSHDCSFIHPFITAQTFWGQALCWVLWTTGGRHHCGAGLGLSRGPVPEGSFCQPQGLMGKNPTKLLD